MSISTRPDFSPIVLITGASRGIGLAAARQLASRGARVILASRDAERAATAAAGVWPGSGAFPLQLDITSDESTAAAAALLEREFPRLDVLINNGAVLLDHYQSLADLPLELLTRTFDTNVTGTLRVTRALLPLLKKSTAPRIVNVSSGAGQLDGAPQAWAPAYSISKTALNMLTRQLTAALPEVAVNSVCPGWCRTDMGGADAPRSAEQGADTAVWLALDAPHEWRGGFFRDRKPLAW